MAVPPFTRAESVLLLQARADGLAAADADRVAAALSDVPLDVAAAGATLAAAGLGADAFLTAVAERASAATAAEPSAAAAAGAAAAPQAHPNPRADAAAGGARRPAAPNGKASDAAAGEAAPDPAADARQAAGPNGKASDAAAAAGEATSDRVADAQQAAGSNGRVSPHAAVPDAGVAAWAVAFDRLADDDPPALALLTLVAWLGPEPVPTDLLAGRADHLPALLATSDPAQLTATLGRRGLARVDGDSLQLHQVPAAHLVRRTSEERPDGAGWAVWAVRLLRAAAPPNPDDPRAGPGGDG